MAGARAATLDRRRVGYQLVHVGTPVRVAVDGRHLRAGAARGVGRYSRLLLGELAGQFPGDEWVVVAADPPQPPLAGVELRRPRLARRLTYGAAAIAGRPRLDRIAGGCDVASCRRPPRPLAVSPGSRSS